MEGLRGERRGSTLGCETLSFRNNRALDDDSRPIGRERDRRRVVSPILTMSDDFDSVRRPRSFSHRDESARGDGVTPNRAAVKQKPKSSSTIKGARGTPLRQLPEALTTRCDARLRWRLQRKRRTELWFGRPLTAWWVPSPEGLRGERWPFTMGADRVVASGIVEGSSLVQGQHSS